MPRINRPDLPGIDRTILEIEREFDRLSAPQIYSTATLPNATKNTGRMVFVTDEGAPAFSDGTDWRLFDGTIIP